MSANQIDIDSVRRLIREQPSGMGPQASFCITVIVIALIVIVMMVFLTQSQAGIELLNKGRQVFKNSSKRNKKLLKRSKGSKPLKSNTHTRQRKGLIKRSQRPRRKQFTAASSSNIASYTANSNNSTLTTATVPNMSINSSTTSSAPTAALQLGASSQTFTPLQTQSNQSTQSNLNQVPNMSTSSSSSSSSSSLLSAAPQQTMSTTQIQAGLMQAALANAAPQVELAPVTKYQWQYPWLHGDVNSLTSSAPNTIAQQSVVKELLTSS
tara:strand:- start:1335 stop:2135 length:801 start_codon:yes stop_codon:yes gene_type:complete